MGVMNLLQSKFENLEIELIATDGSISEQDYDDKIIEAFRQLGIKLGKIRINTNCSSKIPNLI